MDAIILGTCLVQEGSESEEGEEESEEVEAGDYQDESEAAYMKRLELAEKELNGVGGATCIVTILS